MTIAVNTSLMFPFVHSYPGCCVLQQPPITYKCKDAVITSAAFVDCLHSRLPSLCGHQLNYTARPLYPIVGLTTALHCDHSPTNVLPVRRNVSNLAALDLSTNSNSAVVGIVGRKTKQLHPYKPTFPLSKPSPITAAAPVSNTSQRPASIVSPNSIQSQPTQIGNGSSAHQKALNPVIATVPVQKKPPALFNTTTTTPMQKVLKVYTVVFRLIFPV